ncbi:hypothetical protein LZ30DRAFT_716820 [Colletotrichum cereale]|nr:hypothetical protein LZ30DRAFT_716820 [Colletotrichum cereale]
MLFLSIFPSLYLGLFPGLAPCTRPEQQQLMLPGFTYAVDIPPTGQAGGTYPGIRAHSPSTVCLLLWYLCRVLATSVHLDLLGAIQSRRPL